jgi:hypothetical protein
VCGAGWHQRNQRWRRIRERREARLVGRATQFGREGLARVDDPSPFTSNDTVTEATELLSVASTTTGSGSVKPALALAADVRTFTVGGVLSRGPF